MKKSNNKKNANVVIETSSVETIETPLQQIDETIETKVEFVAPLKNENESDIDYAQRVATALKHYNKQTSTKTKKIDGEYKPKLNSESAMIIYDEVVNKKVKQSVLALRYGVHSSTISDIKAGRLYGQVKKHFDGLQSVVDGGTVTTTENNVVDEILNEQK